MRSQQEALEGRYQPLPVMIPSSAHNAPSAQPPGSSTRPARQLPRKERIPRGSSRKPKPLPSVQSPLTFPSSCKPAGISDASTIRNGWVRGRSSR